MIDRDAPKQTRSFEHQHLSLKMLEELAPQDPLVRQLRFELEMLREIPPRPDLLAEPAHRDNHKAGMIVRDWATRTEISRMRDCADDSVVVTSWLPHRLARVVSPDARCDSRARMRSLCLICD